MQLSLPDKLSERLWGVTSAQISNHWTGGGTDHFKGQGSQHASVRERDCSTLGVDLCGMLNDSKIYVQADNSAGRYIVYVSSKPHIVSGSIQ